jgi:hypothetical protein
MTDSATSPAAIRLQKDRCRLDRFLSDSNLPDMLHQMLNQSAPRLQYPRTAGSHPKQTKNTLEVPSGPGSRTSNSRRKSGAKTHRGREKTTSASKRHCFSRCDDQRKEYEWRRDNRLGWFRCRKLPSDPGPSMQTRELREYCGRRGWDLFAEYVDSGIGGTKDRRTELDRLMWGTRLSVASMW